MRPRNLLAPLAAGLSLVGGVLVAAPPASAAATSWKVTSPDGAVVSTVSLTGGTLSMTTKRGSTTLVKATGLGVRTSAGDLSTGLTVTSTTRRAVSGSYTMLTGKRLQPTFSQNELTLGVANATGQTMTLVVRAAPDGAAYRYVVNGSGSYSVTGEPVQYAVPGDATAWTQSYVPWYENLWQSSTAGSAPTGDLAFPAVFRSGQTYTMLTESNVRGTYAGSHLVHPTAGSPTFGLTFFQNDPVSAQGTLTTPWRVQLAGTADQLIGSTLVDDLADPSELADTSWVHPGMSSWSWLAAGASTGAQGDLATQECFVDLSAREGWRYMLVDEGWNPDWMPTLTRYAAARGVSINAWFNSNQLWTDDQMASWFPRLQAWGVTGIKVDFISSDSQGTFDWYDRIARTAAAYHLVIDFHGATIPRGFQRTWPNVMTYEAVHGEEGGRDPVQDTVLPFTRNVLGSMDYTPAVFTNNSQTTKGQELAKLVVYESGLQHPADGPDAYAAQPAAAKYMAALPTAWDDTRYVTGTPGEDAVIARRSGDSWYIGGITDPAKTLQVPLTMLGSGSWLVDLVTDKGTDLVRTTTTETSASVLSIPTREHGGFALEACPATAGRTTCTTTVPPVTDTTVLVNTDKTSVATGDVVTVSGVFVVRANGPAKNVTLDVTVPDTWTLVSGGPVTKASLANGKSINGVWKLRVGPGGAGGNVDVPVAATFTTPSGKAITSADVATLAVAPVAPSGDAYLSDLSFQQATTDYGTVQRDENLSGGAITLGNDPTTYAKGIVANANATVAVYLGGKCSSFTATVGLSPDGDNPSEGSVTFQAFDGTGKALGAAVGSNQNPVTVASGAIPFSVSTKGVQQLVLRIGDAGNGINNDHGAFANAVVHCA